jgi:hypothetical protein
MSINTPNTEISAAALAEAEQYRRSVKGEAGSLQAALSAARDGDTVRGIVSQLRMLANRAGDDAALQASINQAISSGMSKAEELDSASAVRAAAVAGLGAAVVSTMSAAAQNFYNNVLSQRQSTVHVNRDGSVFGLNPDGTPFIPAPRVTVPGEPGEPVVRAPVRVREKDELQGAFATLGIYAQPDKKELLAEARLLALQDINAERIAAGKEILTAGTKEAERAVADRMAANLKHALHVMEGFKAYQILLKNASNPAEALKQIAKSHEDFEALQTKVEAMRRYEHGKIDHPGDVVKEKLFNEEKESVAKMLNGSILPLLTGESSNALSVASVMGALNPLNVLAPLVGGFTPSSSVAQHNNTPERPARP